MPKPVIASSTLLAQRAPADRQFLLQCAPSDAGVIARISGVRLPEAMLAYEESQGWLALHLGPGEWLLIGSAKEPEAPFAAASGELPLSLVDVSARNLAIDIEGEDAAKLLNGACPLDFDSLGPKACTRTVFGKATVMIWRRGEQAWRLAYPRSFDAYVWDLLSATFADISGTVCQPD